MSRIPRRIHQTFSREADLADAHRANIEQIRSLNPGWDYCFYEDADCRDFIRRHYDSRLLGLYDRINPNYGPARADFFRYLLLHEQGGFYLDIKSGLQKPLDSVLRADDVYVLSHWDNGPGEVHAGWGICPELETVLQRGEFVNWYIAAAPRHPFLRRVIDYVADRLERYAALRDGVGKHGVLRTTGPIAYSLAISPIQALHPHRMAELAELGLVYSIFETPGAFRPHAVYSRRHYGTLTEPIVSLPGPSGEHAPGSLWPPVGRNEPCPCGSGKKFKQCHGTL